jgi:hypothetical protein
MNFTYADASYFVVRHVSEIYQFLFVGSKILAQNPSTVSQVSFIQLFPSFLSRLPIISNASGNVLKAFGRVRREVEKQQAVTPNES